MTQSKIEGLPELASTLSRVVAPLVLCGGAWLAPNYFWTFGVFVLLCVTLIVFSHPTIRPLLMFASAALCFGLVNISSWRGYIVPETVRLYGLALFALYAPFALLPRRSSAPQGTISFGPLPTLVLLAQIGIAFAAVALIYSRLGIVIRHQELRFDIPPTLEYVVKSTLPLAAILPLVYRRTLVQVSQLVASILPSLLIGARGSVLIAVLAFLLARALASGGIPRIRKRLGRHLRAAVFGMLSVAVIMGGFYLRRSGNSQLAAASVVADAYFDYDGWWVYAIMPFHLGFREPAGLTNQIIVTPLVNDSNRFPLFVADLVTVLPGEQVAAGQSLGRIVGAVEAGGLTPGLLGGLYLDYGRGAIFIIALLSAALAALALRASYDIRFAPLFITAQMQFLHLFHRGFLKPEYVTSLLIVSAYLWAARYSPPEAPDGSRPSRPL